MARLDTERLKQQLLSKQEELVADISRLESEARESRSAEVEDPIDQVTSSEVKAANFHVSTVEARTLKEVRDALRRMVEDVYGTCMDCGRAIEPARLEAVPWTRYCLADQEKRDRETSFNNESTI